MLNSAQQQKLYAIEKKITLDIQNCGAECDKNNSQYSCTTNSAVKSIQKI